MPERAGFTLVETIIALVLSSVVIILVSTTFLVQNQYYSDQTLFAAAHDNARTVTERVASEIRSVMEEGFVTANATTLTIRTPMLLAVVCNRTGTNIDVHNEGGEAGIDTDEVGGVGWLDTATGNWDYRTTTWAFVNSSGGTPASSCAGNGADTTWAASSFHRLRRFNLLYGATPDPGDVVMLYRETTFTIQSSVLEPSVLGLFRGSYGQSPVELATGMDATAQFQYRTGGSSYANSVTGAANLASIDAVRIVADARARSATGGEDDITFGWSVNIVLPNVP
jgi:prepilin-type N-terminal cleavage/methylation domain-containing protein